MMNNCTPNSNRVPRYSSRVIFIPVFECPALFFISDGFHFRNVRYWTTLSFQFW